MEAKEVLVCGLIGLSFCFGACQNKSVELAPDQVQSGAISLGERVAQKQKLDTEMERVRDTADRVQRLIELLRQVRPPKEGVDVYTPIDFIVDLNKELEGSLPKIEITKSDSTKHKQVRMASIEVPIKSVSAECRIIEAQLESETETEMKKVTVTGSDNKSEVSKEEEVATTNSQMVYSVKTCSTDGKFVPVLSVESKDLVLSFDLDTDGLAYIFQETLDKTAKSVKSVAGCEVVFDSRKIVESFTCKNLVIGLSASEWANLKNLSFSTRGATRLGVEAVIYENETKTADVDFTVNRAGKVDQKNIKEYKEQSPAENRDENKSGKSKT